MTRCDIYREKHTYLLYSFFMLTMKFLIMFKEASTKDDFYQYFWSLSKQFSSIHNLDHVILKQKRELSANERHFRAGIIIHCALSITYQVLCILKMILRFNITDLIC